MRLYIRLLHVYTMPLWLLTYIQGGIGIGKLKVAYFPHRVSLNERLAYRLSGDKENVVHHLIKRKKRNSALLLNQQGSIHSFTIKDGTKKSQSCAIEYSSGAEKGKRIIYEE